MRKSEAEVDRFPPPKHEAGRAAVSRLSAEAAAAAWTVGRAGMLYRDLAS